MNMNLLNALRGLPVDRIPVWCMRQAGRYLPEYRRIRAKAGDFMALCQHPELACEVTLQPLERFDLDAAIIFSDILTIPDAMGLGLRFIPGKGPQFDHILDTPTAIRNLSVPDVQLELHYVFEVMRLVKNALRDKLPVIGFSGSPWTLAYYMLSNDAKYRGHQIKKLMYAEPELLTYLLKILTETVTNYLNAQIQAGADVVMLFDSWGGILSELGYQQFSLPYLAQIVQGLQPNASGEEVPVICFTKGGGLWLEALVAQVKCHAIGLDWTVDLGKARACVGNSIALQGNMDPCVLYASDEVIQKEVFRLIKSQGESAAYIFNLGHGVTPDIEPDKLHVMIEAVHHYCVI